MYQTSRRSSFFVALIVAFSLFILHSIPTRAQNQPNLLVEALKSNDVAKVERLLQEGADPNIKVDANRPAIIFAVSKGKVDMVRTLLKGKANINAQEADGTTALLLAAAGDRADLTNLLLEAKADVNAKGPRGMTALSVVAQTGLADMVKLLIKSKADVNLRDDDGFTPLMAAAFAHKVAVIKPLLGGGADVNAQDSDGWTALMLAAIAGADIPVETAKVDLEKDQKYATINALVNAKADLNMKNKKGMDAQGIAYAKKFNNLALLFLAESLKKARVQ